MGFLSFMKTNSDEKFGRQIGSMAITLCGDVIVKKLINEFRFSDAEIEKLDFWLSIINIIMATWMINFFVRDELRAKIIIDSMRNFFLKSFEGSNFSSKYIYIRCRVRTAHHIIRVLNQCGLSNGVNNISP
jgi:hypothetical protein